MGDDDWGTIGGFKNEADTPLHGPSKQVVEPDSVTCHKIDNRRHKKYGIEINAVYELDKHFRWFDGYYDWRPQKPLLNKLIDVGEGTVPSSEYTTLETSVFITSDSYYQIGETSVVRIKVFISYTAPSKIPEFSEMSQWYNKYLHPEVLKFFADYTDYFEKHQRKETVLNETITHGRKICNDIRQQAKKNARYSQRMAAIVAEVQAEMREIAPQIRDEYFEQLTNKDLVATLDHLFDRFLDRFIMDMPIEFSHPEIDLTLDDVVLHKPPRQRISLHRLHKLREEEE